MLDISGLPTDHDGRIIIAKDLAAPGDSMTITPSDFLKVFASATAVTHAALSSAVPNGSGWHKHLDTWKAAGIIT